LEEAKRSCFRLVVSPPATLASTRKRVAHTLHLIDEAQGASPQKTPAGGALPVVLSCQRTGSLANRVMHSSYRKGSG
jgi:hypothetical protein